MAVCEHFFESHDALLDALCSRITRCLERGIVENDRATLLVSGGSTPVPLFESLSNEDMSWRHVTCALVDERWVPESDKASNAALVRQHLLQNNARHARFQRSYVDDVSIDDRVSALLERGFWRDIAPTVAVLGMGGDLHTASIFPDADHTAAALADDAPSLLHTFPTGTPANPPLDRITLSMPALARTNELVLLLRGAEKRERYEHAKKLPASAATGAPIVALLANPDVRVEVYASP